MSLADRGESAQQHINSLARDRAADVKYFERLGADRTEHARGLAVGLGISLRGKYGGDAVGNRDRPIRCYQAMPQQFVVRRQAVARDHRGASKTAQSACGHHLERPHTEPLRARRSGRLKHRAKGVEVMAGDDRAGFRNVAHQMRVAVIGDVKNVKVAAHAPQMPWIIDESIQQTVRVEHRPAETVARAVGDGARETPLEGRPHQHRINLAGLFHAQPIE